MMGTIFAPFWLIVFAWSAGNGPAVTSVPMPSRQACDAAVAAMPGSLSRTPALGFCIPGGD